MVDVGQQPSRLQVRMATITTDIPSGHGMDPREVFSMGVRHTAFAVHAHGESFPCFLLLPLAIRHVRPYTDHDITWRCEEVKTGWHDIVETWVAIADPHGVLKGKGKGTDKGKGCGKGKGKGDFADTADAATGKGFGKGKGEGDFADTADKGQGKGHAADTTAQTEEGTDKGQGKGHAADAATRIGKGNDKGKGKGVRRHPVAAMRRRSGCAMSGRN